MSKVETSKAPAHYRVIISGVGKFRRGDVVTAGDLGEGVDIERLLRIEALAEIVGPLPARPARAEDTPRGHHHFHRPRKPGPVEELSDGAKIVRGADGRVREIRD